jgi:DNA-binding transcriptional LysR family regulator
MDIPSLQTFVAVAEIASFSTAAERLYLTQPAVSKRVAALEEELGTRLFDRVGRRVSLTEAGRALLPRARTILETVEDSRRAISNLTGRVEGPLKIGTSHHIGLHRLPPVLRAYVTQYPKVDLDIAFLDSEAGMRAVAHGDLELAIVTLPPAPMNSVAATPVWDDPLAVVTAPDHPLGRHKVLTPRALEDHPAILPSEGTYTRQIVEAGFEPLGVKLTVRMSTNYLETIKMLVSVGLGWSILPLSMVDKDLQVHRIPRLRVHRTLGIAEHAERTLSNAARALKRSLLQ